MFVPFVLSAAVAVLGSIALFVPNFLVSIPTGFVGVPITFQKVSIPLLEPGGPHVFNWLTTKIELVETRPQTDVVRNVLCSTNDGVKLVFGKIEIGNQLPGVDVYSVITRFGPNYDKYLVTDLVIHQISVICSKHSAHVREYVGVMTCSLSMPWLLFLLSGGALESQRQSSSIVSANITSIINILISTITTT